MMGNIDSDAHDESTQTLLAGSLHCGVEAYTVALVGGHRYDVYPLPSPSGELEGVLVLPAEASSLSAQQGVDVLSTLNALLYA